MRINTLFYSIRQGFRNIGRNKMFSLASIATMSACIFMFGLFYIIITNFTNMVRVAEESVAVTVFFDEGTTDERMEEIGQEIVKRAEVSKCVFVSAEEAWEDVKQNYFEGREDLAAAFQGDNPVANSAHYEIYLSDVSMQEVLVEYLENMDDVRSVKQSEMVANTLSDFNRLIGYVSAGIILILLCVAVFLISNTVSVGISVRREEIGIMKLIGATDFLVRAPFVVEGMVIGLVGAFIPLALLYFLYGKIILYITEKFNFIGSILDFVAAEEIFRTLVPIAVILGIGIGFVGSFATVRKHLKI
jgi:cell division transport system permease protein